ncbi:MAG TPA: polysaccharide deacetylase family protein [Jatrophihabitantaceae bacterium]|nr:polysaccharide deacetylase family protein [Jatrophihabitantaceae bacterium]
MIGMVAGGHVLPSIVTIPALHNRLLPRLSGRSTAEHVALTFDDGPDPGSTPAFLDELAALGVRATFFLLGSQLSAHPDLGPRIVDGGHEIAVHGWTHRPHLLRTPWDVATDLQRAFECVRDVTGATPHFWRPPNGIVTGAGLRAARQLQLTPVLWTADGRDWARAATAESVAARVLARLAAGGTVLLHDSDVTSAPRSWRSALGSLRAVVAYCAEQGWAVGPLREHWRASADLRG